GTGRQGPRRRAERGAAQAGRGVGRAGRTTGRRRRRTPRGRRPGAPTGGLGDAGDDVTVIIVQTPLRIGLIGGGTDLPSFYERGSGYVLNVAIDKYIYVILKERFDELIYVNYSRKEIVERVDELQHDLVREAMRRTGVLKGVEITTLADIPTEGTGLGS